MQSCENLKVGDYVFVNGRQFRYLSKVENITPSGIIKVNGVFYRKDGSLRSKSDTWYRTFISPASDAEIEEFQKERFVSGVVQRLNSISGLRYEQAVAINRILEGGGVDNA